METARPYLYARTTDDGRAIVGGADKPFATAHQQEKLLAGRNRQDSELVCPALPCHSHHDELELGRDLRRDQRRAALHRTRAPVPTATSPWAGGNGITFGYIATRLLNRFLQRPDPDLEIFRFDR